MSRQPKPYKSYEDLIYKYLTYNGLTISRYIDGRHYRLTQREFSEELGDKIIAAQMSYAFEPQDLLGQPRKEAKS